MATENRPRKQLPHQKFCEKKPCAHIPLCTLIRGQCARHICTVVWNDYLLIFWPNVIFYYTRSWKPNANNQICWITKVSTHSKTLIQFCWKFIYFKDVYWWFLKIWICDKMRALFIFKIIDYAWIFDYVVWFVLKVINKILLMAGVSFA